MNNGFDVSYKEAGGWFGGEGFKLTVTPALESVRFDEVEPFGEMILSFGADDEAGSDLYWARTVERDGSRTDDLSRQQWSDLFNHLSYMSVGPARHLE